MLFKAPFPWFGGKSRAADLIWSRLGDVPNYVEPFAGSLAVLLARPQEPRIETVNDKDGFVANFWRAVKDDPEAVAEHADWPVNENDLHARHIWLVERRNKLQRRLEGDPDFYDPKIAGWWVWGLCCWIGSGWCAGKGPWRAVKDEEGYRQLVHLGDAGRGVNRQRVHLGDAGRGVNRQRVHRGECGLIAWMQALADRLERVRVCCGDWLRVCGPTPTTRQGLTGVFLDPPYSQAERDPGCYSVDQPNLSNLVREWALANGDNPLLRIGLCGYEGEHKMPRGWECVPWKALGGYSNQAKAGRNGNHARERIWFSPACLRVAGKRNAKLVAA